MPVATRKQGTPTSHSSDSQIATSAPVGTGRRIEPATALLAARSREVGVATEMLLT